jgi:hypothetical protein
MGPAHWLVYHMIQSTLTHGGLQAQSGYGSPNGPRITSTVFSTSARPIETSSQTCAVRTLYGCDRLRHMYIF